MTHHTFFLGLLADAPERARAAVGSLLPAEGAVTVLHVPAGARYTETVPLRLAGTSTHLLVHLENGAQADLAVILEGDGDIRHGCEVIAGDEARITLLTLNAVDTGAVANVRQQGLGGAGSSVTWQNVTVGGAAVDHDLQSRLAGRDATSSIEWMFYAAGTERQKLTVRNIFDAPGGAGEILMRGIAQDRAHTACRGMIGIGLQGGGTNTYLTQEVLMLDSTSKVDAIPALEIKTNDVKASHSATVARVTDEDLFYFGARGISPHDARHMFVLGFLGDITQRIADEAMRATVIGAVEEKYGRSASGGSSAA